MSETFGLTGVDVDPLAKPKLLEQQQQLGSGGIKKMVVSSGPKVRKKEQILFVKLKNHLDYFIYSRKKTHKRAALDYLRQSKRNLMLSLTKAKVQEDKTSKEILEELAATSKEIVDNKLSRF